jgi:hypothetical protein
MIMGQMTDTGVSVDYSMIIRVGGWVGGCRSDMSGSIAAIMTQLLT